MKVVGALTVTVHVSLSPPALAVIVAVPTPTGLTYPLSFTVATFLLLVVQETALS